MGAIKEFRGFNLINIFTGSQSWNRQHYGQTIRPKEKLISINFFSLHILNSRTKPAVLDLSCNDKYKMNDGKTLKVF